MSPTQDHRRRARAAFTMFEMLIVIALIGLLATVAVVNFGNLFSRSEQDIARMFVNDSLDPALLAYKMHVGHYPSTEEGLNALLAAPQRAGARWGGPYIKGGSIPLDPWKNPYRYRYPATKSKKDYDIYSLGPDGVESADDIGNWETATAQSN